MPDAAPPSEVLWSLTGVSLDGAPRPRLDDVTAAISTGATAILGRSGAGKSSLLNLLVGFESPTRGVVSREFDAAGRLPDFWVPPDEGLWPHLTVEQHIAAADGDFGLSILDFGFSRGRANAPGGAAKQSKIQNPKSKIADWLARFGLAELIHVRADRLSQGERARLTVARALASDAAVLVLDEPLLHVEPARSAACWEVLVETARERGTSLVIATHAPEIVLRVCPQVLCLEAGRLVWQGATDDLYHRPPSPFLAEFLGPVNWFTPSEAATWLDGAAGIPEQGRGFRPERLEARVDEASPLVVERTAFVGAVEEVELRDERSQATRRVVRRPARTPLQAGMRVALQVFCLLAACLLGCDGGDPVIPVKAVSSWAVPPERSRLPAPRTVAVGPGEHEVIVLDTAGRVLVYNTTSGQCVRKWYMPEHAVGRPEGIWCFQDGRIGVADTHYQRVVFFDHSGTVVGMHGSYGKGDGEFIYPVSIVQDETEAYYVTEYGGHDRIQKFAKDGTFLWTAGAFGSGPGEFQRPGGIVIHRDKIYIADAFNNRIQIFTTDGRFERVLVAPDLGGTLNYPYDLSQDAAGHLFVAEYGGNRVTELDAEGRLLGRYGSPGTELGQFVTPWGLTVLPDGRILVTDTGNRRIVELQR